MGFKGCMNLINISIPSTVYNIAKEAFKDCTHLSSITLPNGIKYIGDGAFFNTDIKSVRIPSSCHYQKEFEKDYYSSDTYLTSFPANCTITLI